MICISISQESPQFALVDMFNAGPQCDLLEVRLDRIGRGADIGTLLARKPKPVVMTCRRAEDGGDWQGTEVERVALLRQCFVPQAEYVEVELDVADQLPPAPPTKRVIAYTNLLETPEDLHEIYQKAVSKKPDVIKLALPVRTPEEIWPVVQILAKPAVPTVIMGVGKPGIMLTLLAKKMDAPWAYAALERGMESYFGQPTVRDLETVYHYRAMGRATPLVGVTGFDEWQHVMVALLNASFTQLDQPTRCLPLAVGELPLFRKVLEAIRLTSAVIHSEHQSAIRQIAAHLEPLATLAQAADLIAHKGKEWQGYNTFCRAAVGALTKVVGRKDSAEKPLHGCTVVLVGVEGQALALASLIEQVGGTPVLAGGGIGLEFEPAPAHQYKSISLDDVARMPHEILIVCEDSDLHPGYLRPGMTVLDVTTQLRKSAFLWAAERRGCRVVSPQQVLVEQVARLVKSLTGKEVSEEALVEVMKPLMDD
jgi:3-dehydroquinate dehydratase/shikimate dehydrogenase